ncbi:hypothetical protein, partial [Bradyrhizobium betae]|uniref:hypothetical protein n=1 Tax=Bradyrhizobium betae TaxID=244734 RepID=UPI0019D6EEC1
EPSQDGQADPNAHLGVETAKAIGPHRADANTSDYCFPFSTESVKRRRTQPEQIWLAVPQ